METTVMINRIKHKLQNHARFKSATRLDTGNEALQLPYTILVGTHHKTGTTWMSRIFKDICKSKGLKFHNDKRPDPPVPFDIYFAPHSEFDLSKVTGEYRGLHIIRDPRDRIVSGAFYHQKSDEAWLHHPLDELGGKTYQQAINELPSLSDKMVFEMKQSGGSGINEMIQWNYQNDSFIEIKYENLIQDDSLTLFHEIFTHLGFPGGHIPSVLQIAYANSLFSGGVKTSVHVRSGKPQQWKQHFSRMHGELFVELFGDVLIQLGYETDNQWVNSLPAT